jgi:27-O-demethylrifamycin SV methyltransferase
VWVSQRRFAVRIGRSAHAEFNGKLVDLLHFDQDISALPHGPTGKARKKPSQFDGGRDVDQARTDKWRDAFDSIRYTIGRRNPTHRFRPLRLPARPTPRPLFHAYSDRGAGTPGFCKWLCGNANAAQARQSDRAVGGASRQVIAREPRCPLGSRSGWTHSILLTQNPSMAAADDPVTHYDNVTRAWQYLLGEDFHYGYFTTERESLEAATSELTVLMAKKAAIGPGMSVLDVGCGIGNPACFLAERYGCRVTGISTSPKGIEHARRLAEERGCSDRVSFSIADGMDNGMPDASFDRVWVLESSHLMQRKDALLAECARVLRRGGSLVLCDIILRRDLPPAEILSRSRDFLHLHYAFGHAKLEALETYRQHARRAGLEVLETLDISDSVFPTLIHWRRKLEENSEPVRALIGDEGVEHFRASCEILPTLWEQRFMGYGLVVAAKGRADA